MRNLKTLTQSEYIMFRISRVRKYLSEWLIAPIPGEHRDSVQNANVARRFAFTLENPTLSFKIVLQTDAYVKNLGE